MIYGLYLSAQGAKAQSTRLNVIANNLANASTSGFKRSLAVFQQLRNDVGFTNESGDIPSDSTNASSDVRVSEVVTDFAQGPLQETRAPFDIALSGNGFLQVADRNGQAFLTRNGRLTINEDGELVMAGNGHRVLSANGGTIELPGDMTSLQIEGDGTVNAVVPGGVKKVGRIGVVMPRSLAGLKARGRNLYQSTTPVRPINDGASIVQGYIEGSSVNAIRAMQDLIETSRTFEMNANVIKHQDESLGRLLQALPRR